MKSFSQFPQATDLTNDDLLLISQWDGFSSYVTKYVTANLCESVSKKEFICQISQFSTNAPIITIIKDDFNDTYTTSYSSVGVYLIQGFDSDLLGDEEMYINMASIEQGCSVIINNQAVNEIRIQTFDSSISPSDSKLSGISTTYLHVIKYL
jgi:hypothetical protein